MRLTWKKTLCFSLVFWRTFEMSQNSIFRVFTLLTHEHFGNCSVNMSPEHFLPWNYQIFLGFVVLHLLICGRDWAITITMRTISFLCFSQWNTVFQLENRKVKSMCFTLLGDLESSKNLRRYGNILLETRHIHMTMQRAGI